MIHGYIVSQRTQKNTVTIGGQAVKVPEMTLDRLMALIVHLSPYIPLLETVLPDIQAGLKDASGQRPQVLYQIFLGIRPHMAQVPGDIIKTLGLLLDKDPEWLAQTIKPAELVEAMKKIDDLYNIMDVWTMVREWTHLEFTRSG